MKNRKTWIAALMALITAFACAGCGNDITYDDVEHRYGNYIQVTYDIADGTWRGNVAVTLEHRYKKDANGEAKLYVPGERPLEMATPTKPNHFVEGWYTDENFTTRWNFDTDKTSKDMTLYARWLPRFRYTFYCIDETTGKPVALNSIYVNQGGRLTTSATPTREGYTFLGQCYSDDKLQTPWDYSTTHIGKVVDGVQTDLEMPVYTTWLKGEYTLVNDGNDLAGVLSSNIYMMTDEVDFGKTVEGTEIHEYTWAGDTGYFNGTFEGNNAVIKNIELTYPTNATGRKNSYGLFGGLGDNAVIRNVTFENITLTINDELSLPRDIGLLAGIANAGAKLENVVITGKIVFKNISPQIDGSSYGTIFGMDNRETKNGVDGSGITYDATELQGYTVTLDADGTFVITVA